MLEFLPAPDDVVAIALAGTLTREDVELCFAACRDRLARHDTISACVDISGLEGFTAEALMDDVAEAAAALGWMDRVRRKALITASPVWHWSARVASSLVSRPKVRAFAPDAAADALEWACGG